MKKQQTHNFDKATHNCISIEWPSLAMMISKYVLDSIFDGFSSHIIFVFFKLVLATVCFIRILVVYYESLAEIGSLSVN